MKDGSSFIKFLKSIYSSHTIHGYETADILGDHFFMLILVEEYSELLVFPFLSCFLYHLSITGVICCLPIFSEHITSLEWPSKSFD